MNCWSESFWRCIKENHNSISIQKHFSYSNNIQIYQTNSISFSFQLSFVSPKQIFSTTTKNYQNTSNWSKNNINNQTTTTTTKKISIPNHSLDFHKLDSCFSLPPSFKQKKVSNLFFRNILSLSLYLSVCPLFFNFVVVFTIWKQKSPKNTHL